MDWEELLLKIREAERKGKYRLCVKLCKELLLIGEWKPLIDIADKWIATATWCDYPICAGEEFARRALAVLQLLIPYSGRSWCACWLGERLCDLAEASPVNNPKCLEDLVTNPLPLYVEGLSIWDPKGNWFMWSDWDKRGWHRKISSEDTQFLTHPASGEEEVRVYNDGHVTCGKYCPPLPL